MQTFTHDGFTFDLVDSGPPDGRVVILLHGFPQSKAAWSEVAPHLTDAGLRVLAPDQRGYSPGARPEGRRAYQSSALTADVLALADAAGAQRFHLVGHDWGALVAWELAAHHPDRVETLTTLSVPHPRAFAASMVRSSQVLRSWYMLAFQIPGVERLAVRRDGALFRRGLAGTGMTEERIDEAAARMTEPGALASALNWYRAIPFSGANATPEVTVPTTHVWSSGDSALTRAGAELTGRFVTGPYRLEILEGVSHWIPEEVPDRAAEIILARVSGTQ
ncbi:MAG: alpha/beta fold hydrolase [Actinomycetota bacterium]|nr:alpha/beta fold hydrolase [Actinomycetota bacterium]